MWQCSGWKTKFRAAETLGRDLLPAHPNSIRQSSLACNHLSLASLSNTEALLHSSEQTFLLDHIHVWPGFPEWLHHPKPKSLCPGPDGVTIFRLHPCLTTLTRYPTQFPAATKSLSTRARLILFLRAEKDSGGYFTMGQWNCSTIWGTASGTLDSLAAYKKSDVKAKSIYVFIKQLAESVQEFSPRTLLRIRCSASPCPSTRPREPTNTISDSGFGFFLNQPVSKNFIMEASDGAY